MNNENHGWFAAPPFVWLVCPILVVVIYWVVPHLKWYGQWGLESLIELNLNTRWPRPILEEVIFVEACLFVTILPNMWMDLSVDPPKSERATRTGCTISFMGGWYMTKLPSGNWMLVLDRQDENGTSPNSCVKHFLKRSMFHYHVRLLQGIMNSMHYLHLWSLGTLRHCRNSSFLMVRSKTSYTLVVILLNSRLLLIFTMYPPKN